MTFMEKERLLGTLRYIKWDLNRMAELHGQECGCYYPCMWELVADFEKLEKVVREMCGDVEQKNE